MPTKSWRNTTKIHPACELFPPLPPDELPALGEDIIKHGLTSPVVLWSDGKSPEQLLDGRNRLDAIEIATGSPAEIGVPSIMAGKDFLAINKVITLDKSVNPFAYVISANIHRRHLTDGQKRELIATVIKADPSKSDRQIAETVKASPTTVGTVRREIEPTVQSGQSPPKRVGKDGIARKVTNRPRQKVSENQELKQRAVKPTSDEPPLTVLIELLRQILTDANQAAWLKPLSSRKQQQAVKLVERLRSNLNELVALRQTAAKAMPDITPPPPPPPASDMPPLPDFLDRTKAAP